MWVIQELIAARRFLPLFGRTRLTMEAVVTHQFQPADLWSKYKNHFEILKLGFQSATDRSIALNNAAQLLSNKRTSLLNWLMFSKDNACTDPKDRVFALVNIIPIDERETLGVFFPDYTLSLERVQLITIAFIRQSNDSTGPQEVCSELLHIHSRALQEEFVAKTGPEESFSKARSSHYMRLAKNPINSMRNKLADRAVDDTWAKERLEALRIIASKPLSCEAEQQAKLVRTKSWYVNLESV